MISQNFQGWRRWSKVPPCLRWQHWLLAYWQLQQALGVPLLGQGKKVKDGANKLFLIWPRKLRRNMKTMEKLRGNGKGSTESLMAQMSGCCLLDFICFFSFLFQHSRLSISMNMPLCGEIEIDSSKSDPLTPTRLQGRLTRIRVTFLTWFWHVLYYDILFCDYGKDWWLATTCLLCLSNYNSLYIHWSQNLPLKSAYTLLAA